MSIQPVPPGAKPTTPARPSAGEPAPATEPPTVRPCEPTAGALRKAMRSLAETVFKSQMVSVLESIQDAFDLDDDERDRMLRDFTDKWCVPLVRTGPAGSPRGSGQIPEQPGTRDEKDNPPRSTGTPPRTKAPRTEPDAQE